MPRKVFFGSCAESNLGVGQILEFDSTDVVEYFRDTKEGGWWLKDIHGQQFHLYDLRVVEGTNLTWEEPNA